MDAYRDIFGWWCVFLEGNAPSRCLDSIVGLNLSSVRKRWLESKQREGSSANKLPLIWGGACPRMFADMAKFTVVGLRCALYVVHIYERIVPFTGLAAKSHTDQEILDSWSSAQICRSKIRSYTHPQTGKRFGDTSWSL